MRLDFSSISIERFKSFDKRQTWKLVDEPGLYHVKGINDVEPHLGSNGSGKTSVWDALVWCLTGRTLSGLRGTDIQPWSGSGQTIVSLNVTTDGKDHDVVRTANPNSLKIDDKVVAQDAVDRLIGMTFDTIAHTLVFGQGQPLFPDLTPTEKLEVFSTALGLQRWEDRSGAASEKAKKIEAGVRSLESNLIALNEKGDTLEKLLKDTKVLFKTWNEEHELALTVSDKNIRDAKSTWEKLEARYNKASTEYDVAMVEVKATKGEQEKILKEKAGINHKLSLREGVVERAMIELSELREHLKSAKRTKRCPTCGQEVDAEAAKFVHRDLEAKIRSLESTVNNTSVAASAMAVLNEENEAYTHALRKAEKAEKDFQATADTHRLTMDRLAPRVGEAKAVVETLRKAKQNAENAVNPHRKQLESLKKQLREVTAEERRVENKLNDHRAWLERVQFWVKGFKDVRLYIMEEALDELEMVTNTNLEELGLVGWRFRYDVEKETRSGTIKRGINITILSPYNKGWVKWESWSGGESQRLRLASALALSEVLLSHAGIDPGMEVLDEPTRHLTKEGIKSLAPFLAARARDIKRRTYYTDHQAVDSKHFMGEIIVHKTSSGSI
ncbi:MAG: AAA family ATPase, partial [Anaerolineae bacterium]|nr:AAA family ATPase [Anaerolineae bacterium]